jgi:S-adenosylmethionine-dependent methyltransferase
MVGQASMSRDARAEVFERRTEAWVVWQTTPWGRLRYRLVARTLGTALERLGAPCRVLDAGGGDGADSLLLAGQGHDVTILDHAGALLARAAAAAAGLAGRVRTVRADLDEPTSLDLVGTAGFDLVLCHNVLHYLADVPATVDRLVRMVRPGGVLSLLAPNPAMDVLAMAIRRTSPADALALLDAGTVRSETFDRDMRRLDASSVEPALISSGCWVSHRFGIRCVIDLIADDELKSDPTFFADLERLELELCDREPYRQTARFWQVLAVRGP